MIYSERIFKILGRIIKDTSRIRKKGFLYSVPEIVSQMQASSRIEKFVELFLVEYVVYGNAGECGLAVFMDKHYHEIIRVLFAEDDEKVTCWIDNKQQFLFPE